MPRLDLGGIASGAFASSRASSAVAMESTDHRPSLTITVVHDPDAVPEPVENETNHEHGDEGKAARGRRSATASSAPTSATKDSRSRLMGLSTSSTALSMKKEMGRYYQNKNLLSPEKAAAKVAARAAMKGDLAARRVAAEQKRLTRISMASTKKEDSVKRRAAMRIQAVQRARRAVRFVKTLKLQAWALDVVSRGLIRWHRRAVRKRREAAKKAEEEEFRQSEIQRRAAERAAARAAAKEEVEARRSEKEEEEAKRPGAARRRAKQKAEKSTIMEQMKREKERKKAATAAQEAAKVAQEEAQREEQRKEERRQALLLEAVHKAQRGKEAKLQAARELAVQQQAARDEAIAAVRTFAEGLQELAVQASQPDAPPELGNELRFAGAVPPLVAMLGSGVVSQCQSAAATALTHMAATNEPNRTAIRKAGGVKPLTLIAGQSQKNGSLKHIAALTNMALGSHPDNQRALREAGAVPILVSLLNGGPDSKVTCEALVGLRHLTYNNPMNCNALREAGGITWLVTLLQAGADHAASVDAAATLTQICADNPANQDALRESGGIRPLIGLLSGSVDSEVLHWASRCLSNISRDNATNRQQICEVQGTILRLVTLLGTGGDSEGARLAAEVLRCLMLGNDDRIALAVLAAMRRLGVGLGETATFKLADAFPSLLQGLAHVVGSRLRAAVLKGTDERGHIQMALNDAIALELPEQELNAARNTLEAIARAKEEAIAARKAKSAQRRLERRQLEAERLRAAAAANSASTKQATGSSKDELAVTTNSELSGAMATLLQAQQRLKALEVAAAAARRARREAVQERAASGKPLSPEARRAFTRQKLMGAFERVSAAAAAARAAVAHGDHSDDEHDHETDQQQHHPRSPEQLAETQGTTNTT
jgi:hypothetical protein